MSDWKLAPVPFNKFIILMLYFSSGNEYFLSSIVSCDDLTIEKDVGGFAKDESCTIEDPCLDGKLCRSMRTMLFFGRSAAVVSLFRNSICDLVESLGSLVLSALDQMLLPHAIVLVN